MKIELKKWLNSLSAKDFYFAVFILLAILGFLFFSIQDKKEKEARIFQTKLLKACQEKKKVFLKKDGDKRTRTVKGMFLDAEDDFFSQNNQQVIFVEKESEKFNPLLGRILEVEGFFWSNESGVYFIEEKDIVNLQCTGEELKIPEGLETWMEYLSANINKLSSLRGGQFFWKVEAFVLKEQIEDYVYVYYSNFESAKKIEEIQDRVLLIKLSDLESKKMEIIFDSRLDENGEILEKERDLFFDRLDVAEFRLNEEKKWSKVN